MDWESGIDIYALLCVKQVDSGNLIYSAGSSAQCSMMAWRGGMGEGGRLRKEGYMYTYS